MNALGGEGEERQNKMQFTNAKPWTVLYVSRILVLIHEAESVLLFKQLR